jgi:ferredoxin, 2Fe-2S
MIHVTLIDADGRSHQVSGRAGKSLMQVATRGGVESIAADCGGVLTCATCHVVVDPAWAGRLPAPAADEDAMLDMTATPRQAGSRLSCQIQLEAGLDGLVVRVPATQY